MSDMVAFVNLHPYPDPKWNTTKIEVSLDEQEYRWNKKNVWFIKLVDFLCSERCGETHGTQVET